jgi:hypothetical protein
MIYGNCSIPGCKKTNIQLARGLCSNHYMQVRSYAKKNNITSQELEEKGILAPLQPKGRVPNPVIQNYFKSKGL